MIIGAWKLAVRYGALMHVIFTYSLDQEDCTAHSGIDGQKLIAAPVQT